jgi:hypothetical protein
LYNKTVPILPPKLGYNWIKESKFKKIKSIPLEVRERAFVMYLSSTKWYNRTILEEYLNEN